MKRLTGSFSFIGNWSKSLVTKRIRINQFLRERQLLLETLEIRAVPAAFVVNTTNDTVAVDLVSGKDSAGQVSLRSAVMAANNTAGDNTITLPAGTFKLTRAGAGEDAARTGDLDLRSTISIQGVSSETTIIDANALDRVFQVTDFAQVTLNHLTIQNGKANYGGGIYNSGKLTLDDVSIVSNVASGVDGSKGNNTGESGGNGTAAYGGGIYNAGKGVLSVVSTTLTSNKAVGSKGGSGVYGSVPDQIGGTNGGNGGRAYGGGLYNAGGKIQASGVSSYIDFDGNSAQAGNGGNAGGGASADSSVSGGDGTAGGKGGSGGAAFGGALYLAGGSLAGVQLSFENNFAKSGNGASGGGGGWGASGSSGFPPSAGARGGNGGNGGLAAGGAMYMSGGYIGAVNQFSMDSNYAQAGSGGYAGGVGYDSTKSVSGADGGQGGEARGGGIDIESGQLNFNQNTQVTLNANSAIGGDSGAASLEYRLSPSDNVTPGKLFDGAQAMGGSIYSSAGRILSLHEAVFFNNYVRGGLGSEAAHSPLANGGNGLGGALYMNGGEAQITKSKFSANTAYGAQGNAGRATINSPPAIGEPASQGGAGIGGGIMVAGGNFQLSATTLINNAARGGAGGTGGAGGWGRSASGSPGDDGGNGGRGGDGGLGQGGALAASGGTVTIDRCTFSDSNQAAGGQAGTGGTPGLGGTGTPQGKDGQIGDSGTGGSAIGGAVFDTNATLTMTNDTLSGNIATPGKYGTGSGGAIYNQGTASLINVTIARNKVLGATTDQAIGGGLVNSSGTLKMLNTLVTLNTIQGGVNTVSPDVSGTITSLGHNLVSIRDGSTGLSISNDLTGTAATTFDAGLDSLKPNGGRTQTCKLLAGSKAIDAGATGSTVPLIDQRGTARPRGKGIDIGAFEL